MKKNIFVWIALMAITFFVSSCLKDDVSVDWTSVSGKVYAEFTNHFPGTAVPFGLYGKPDAQTTNVMIDITTLTPSSKDITITLDIDTDAITLFNTRAHAQDSLAVPYQHFPDADVVFPSTVTIKAGQTTVWFTVAIINADQVDPLTKWMIPLHIKDASGLALTTNKNDFLLSPLIKSIYDGIYHAVGFRHHPALGDLASDKLKHLSTVNSTTVESPAMADYPYRMDMQVNGDNSVTITSPDVGTTDYTDPSLDPVGRGIPAGVNSYDPVNKVFHVFIFYNSAAPRIITETYTWVSN